MTIQADNPTSASADLPEDADQLSAKLRHRRRRPAAARTPPAGPPARLRGVVDLRLRRAHPVRPQHRHPHRASCWRSSAPRGGTTRATGLFVNSLHLWSVEIFFFFMVIHLWGKFFMAAWRGKRRATWITGVIRFVVSVGAAFTGYLSQQNFDSQWIATQAKDGINSTGAGAVFNVLNFGQMLMWHIVLLPLVIGLLVGIHVLLVRIRGVVPPFALPGSGRQWADPDRRGRR